MSPTPEPTPVEQEPAPPSKALRDYQQGKPTGESFLLIDKNGTTVFVLEG